jgi:hypothetical protein
VVLACFGVGFGFVYCGCYFLVRVGVVNMALVLDELLKRVESDFVLERWQGVNAYFRISEHVRDLLSGYSEEYYRDTIEHHFMQYVKANYNKRIPIVKR